MNRRLKTNLLVALLAALSAVPTLGMPSAQGAPKGAKEKAAAKKKGKLAPGLYTGGGFADSVQYVSLRVGGTRRRATETATLTFDCGRFRSRLVDTLGVKRAVLRGGRGEFDAPVLEDVPAQVPEIGGLRRKGSIAGKLRVDRDGTAHGSVRSRFTLTDPVSKRRVARCDSGLVRWQGRLRPGKLGETERGRPLAAPAAGYFGRTTQKRPFALEVAKRGRVVQRIGMTFDARCPSALGRPLELSAAQIPIKRRGEGRGSFAKTGTFKRTFTDPRLGVVSESYRWRLAGRFGPKSVAGGWKVTGTANSAAGTSACTTGRNRWRAIR